MSKKASIFKITLTPITPYYFGQEMSTQLGNKNDYFQKSAVFPQQTAILGALRHKILKDNDIDLDERSFIDKSDRDVKHTKAASLVGENGFEMKADKSLNNYSSIINISPIFLSKNGALLYYENKEYIKNVELNEELCLDGTHSLFRWKDNLSGTREDYISKHISEALLSKQKANNLLHEENYVGIHKGGIDPMDKKDSFFLRTYQNLYEKEDSIKSKMGINFSSRKLSIGFTFFACIDKNIPLNTNTDFMLIGKEQSAFKWTTSLVKNVEIPNDDLYCFEDEINAISDESNIIKLILLSDAYLDQNELDKLNSLCILQNASQQRFRFIKRKVRDVFYKGSKPLKTNNAYQLLSRGSVFFIEHTNKVQVENLFTEKKAFRQIGYNYYQIKKANIL